MQALSDAIWTHKLVIVRGQKNLQPQKQWDLVKRFDPDAEEVHSHGDMKTFNAKGGLLSVGHPYSFSFLRSNKPVASPDII